MGPTLFVEGVSEASRRMPAASLLPDAASHMRRLVFSNCGRAGSALGPGFTLPLRAAVGRKFSRRQNVVAGQSAW